MDFYQQLLDNDITLQDLTDKQLVTLIGSWENEDGVLQPTSTIWDAAGKEQRQREIDRAWKPKPIDKGFYS